MRHFELNSVSAGFENCGLTYALSRPAIKVQKSALICRTKNETNRWNIYCTKLWKFCRIVYEGFVTDLLWNNSGFVAAKVIVTIAKFLLLIGGEKSAAN